MTRRSRPTATASPSPSGSRPSTPAIHEWQRDLSVSLRKIGDVLLAQGKLDEALKAYRDSLAIRERLAAADPSNTAVAARSVGVLRQDRRRAGGAGEARRGAQGLPRRPRHHASGWPPPTPATPRGSTICQRPTTRSATCWWRRGKLEEALRAYRDRLAISERLVAADPSNAGGSTICRCPTTALATCSWRWASLRKRSNPIRDGLAIRERLAAADPGNIQWQLDLSASYGRVGRCLGRTGQA